MRTVFSDKWKTVIYALGLMIATPLLLACLVMCAVSLLFLAPALLFGLWFVGLFTRFRASWGGIAYDGSMNEISFPGSNASSWGIIVKRVTVPVSDIHTIRDGSNSYWHEGEQYFEYKIQISGPFGSHTVQFGSEGSKNELYDFLMSHNDMGQPVNVGGRGGRREPRIAI